ncbi:hypothetical protein XA68_15208 [Ophiocordyceps unilateralis]|uniref:Tyrosine--tRNA ligase n=1 Tax=Ophiocordyceps unilateralis TaxID=268505 RepID=A0A2A9P925_OPHUN|nr:hypothetical protein XA68_15208 [Ophiocordyceps unilateralis]
MASRRISSGTCMARYGRGPRDTVSVVLCARRSVSHSHLAKVAAAQERWAMRAQRIKQGEMKSGWDVLEERGFIKDVAGHRKVIGELIRLKRIGAYVGVDPTSDSMHVGHLVPIMALFWLWYQGHPAILLLGGSTARIGDPSGRRDSRPIMSNADISRNITKLHFQMSKLWFNVDAMRHRFGVEDDWGAKHHLLNNSMWQQGLTMYEFNKRISRHVRLGPMLSREWVKERLTNGSGMSFGEFMYPLLQGWDFWHVYNKLSVQMQIGGSDQFGNIVTGIEALKIIRESEEFPGDKMDGGWLNEPCGFTTPLLTDSSGNKVSKTEDNASSVSLDEFQTTPFNLYGYFVRQPDDQVERLLKLLTFTPLDKIQELMQEHERDPTRRVAQHALAFEVVCLAHGIDRANKEAQQHKLMYASGKGDGGAEQSGEGGAEQAGDGKWTPGSTAAVTPNNAPQSDMELPDSVMNLSPGRILQAVGLAGSSSEGHRMTVAQGAYVAASPGQERGLVPGNLSWTPMKMWFPGETRKFLIDDKLLILRKGKHNVRIVRLVSDEEWKKSGRTYPGEAFTGVVRRMKDDIVNEAKERGEKLDARQLTIELRNKVNSMRRENKSLKAVSLKRPWQPRGQMSADQSTSKYDDWVRQNMSGSVDRAADGGGRPMNRDREWAPRGRSGPVDKADNDGGRPMSKDRQWDPRGRSGPVDRAADGGGRPLSRDREWAPRGRSEPVDKADDGGRPMSGHEWAPRGRSGPVDWTANDGGWPISRDRERAPRGRSGPVDREANDGGRPMHRDRERAPRGKSGSFDRRSR